MDTDILIVGAGPTGLMLANQLGRRGIRAMIIDRHSGPAQQSRAMAVHARSLEIFSKLGIAGQAVERGRRGNGTNMRANGKRMARIPLGEIGKSVSPFPYVLMLSQDASEHIMGEHLHHWGMAVQWNTELMSFEQAANQVTATLKLPDGTTRNVTAAARCANSRGSPFPAHPMNTYSSSPTRWRPVPWCRKS
jgi:2-polyprenyl-6-methoxyphenol hydroxylase-like FAD-dependent oxidoreductase